MRLEYVGFVSDDSFLIKIPRPAELERFVELVAIQYNRFTEEKVRFEGPKSENEGSFYSVTTNSSSPELKVTTSTGDLKPNNFFVLYREPSCKYKRFRGFRGYLHNHTRRTGKALTQTL